ncbi:MAG: PD-(D/E)XK nuclease family protein [Acidobacteriota bacterium]|nr:PD-(D/E)XK nuclease family protein [Acidobacteriota bacterium]
MWTVRPPETIGTPPEMMSFTALRAIERCPLQWALTYGDYPEIWKRKGYPRRQHRATLVGQLVHGTIEVIAKELKNQGTAAGDELTAALRLLGGITAVLKSELKKLSLDLSKNPRVTELSRIQLELERSVPDMRNRVQLFLSQLDALGVQTAQSQQKDSHDLLVRSESAAKALPYGSHSEVELRLPDGSWHGKADLIVLKADECGIVDFKTGGKKEDHSLQLRLYALLWKRDSQLNPIGRIANRLALIYTDGEISIPPPGEEEIGDLEIEMQNRALTARIALGAINPEARPGLDSCGYCEVKQLCPAFWTPAVQALLSTAQEVTGTLDAELDLTNSVGEWSWKAVVKSCGNIKPGTTILLQGIPRESLFKEVLNKSRTVRALSLRSLPTEQGANSLPVLALTRGSEVFRLS